MKPLLALIAIVTVFTSVSAFAEGSCGGCPSTEGGKKKEAPKDTATLSIRL